MTTKYSVKLLNLDSKNKPRSWEISVADLGTYAEIAVITGLVEGKKTTRKTKVTKGKNIGKTNETTYLEQAIKDAKSKEGKQRQKEGYDEELPAKPGLNGLGLERPMLAESYKADKRFSDVLVDPKLDGYRLMHIRQGGKDRLYTREGVELEIPHIQNALARLDLPEGTQLDGELYNHDLTFQKISSAASAFNCDTHKLEYWVYDMVSKEDAYIRNAEIQGLLASASNIVVTESTTNDPLHKHPIEETIQAVGVAPLKLCPTYYAVTREEWDDLHAKFIAEGYEGSIGRLLYGKYIPNGRNSTMVKRKDFFDREYKIVGIDRNIKPYTANGANTPQAQLICQTEEGKEFRASLEGGVEDRYKLYLARDEDFVGKMATVKYFEKTDDGIPRFPVARRRDDLPNCYEIKVDSKPPVS